MKPVITIVIIIVAAVALITVGKILPDEAFPSILRQSKPLPVCGRDILEQYNATVKTAEELGSDANTFDDVANTVKQKQGYEHDIVCSYILLKQASVKGDPDTAKSTARRINESFDKPQDVELIMEIGLTKSFIKDFAESVSPLGELRSEGRG